MISPVIGDWLSISAVCNNNCAARCTKSGKKLCCLCAFSTDEKMGGWREHPHIQWRRDLDGRWQHSRLWSVQPSQVLWGVRHVLTRSLDYVLHTIEDTLASQCSRDISIHSAFMDFMEDVSGEWGSAVSLTIKKVCTLIFHLKHCIFSDIIYLR